MNWFDLVIVLIFLWYVIQGARSGLLGILIDLASLAAGIVLGLIALKNGSGFFQKTWAGPAGLNQILSFIIIWVAGYFSLSFFGKKIVKMLKWKIMPLGILDLILGGFLGFLRGGLVVGLALLLISLLSLAAFLPAPLERGYKNSLIFQKSSLFVRSRFSAFGQFWPSFQNSFPDGEVPRLFNTMNFLNLFWPGKTPDYFQDSAGSQKPAPAPARK